jgi:hypothetical protein
VPEVGRLNVIVHPVGVDPAVPGTGALVVTRAAALVCSNPPPVARSPAAQLTVAVVALLTLALRTRTFVAPAGP